MFLYPNLHVCNVKIMSQMRANKGQEEDEVDKDENVAKSSKSHPATLEQMLRAVTTASPTITISSVVKSQNYVTSTVGQKKIQNHMTSIPNILRRGKQEAKVEVKVSDSKPRLEDTMLAKELTKNDKIKKASGAKTSGKTRKPTDLNKNKKIRLDKSVTGVGVKSQNQTSLLKPPPVVKIKNVKVNNSSKEMIGLNDVIEVVTIPTVQLSPTLEHKLETSTGVIENLDRFCAVADIVSGSGNCSEEEDIDIDIENEDENEDNFILKNRSTSPNSVYESLLKSAKVRTKPSKAYIVKEVVNEKSESENEADSKEEEADIQEYIPGVCSESSEDGMSETGNQSGVVSESDYQSDSNLFTERKIGILLNFFYRAIFIFM